MSNAKIITNTTEDIKSFAEKIANSDRPLSKLEILNLWAGTTQGPKITWGGITNAKKPVVSQRASEILKKAPAAPAAPAIPHQGTVKPIKTLLQDEFHHGLVSLAASIDVAPTGISIKSELGQEIFVEFYNDCLTARVYNDISEAPVIVRSQPGHVTTFDNHDYYAERHPAAVSAALAGSTKTGRIVGFQVSDLNTGELYGDQPENHVFGYAKAKAMLDEALSADLQNFMIATVHEGEIEDAVYIPDSGKKSTADDFVAVACLQKNENGDLDVRSTATPFEVFIYSYTAQSHIERFRKVVGGLTAAEDYARELGEKYNVEYAIRDLGIDNCASPFKL